MCRNRERESYIEEIHFEMCMFENSSKTKFYKSITVFKHHTFEINVFLIDLSINNDGSMSNRLT